MQAEGGGHVLITDFSVAPVREEEAKEKTTSQLPAHTCVMQSLCMHDWLLSSSERTWQRKAVHPKVLSCAVPSASLIPSLTVLNKYTVSEEVLALPKSFPEEQ